MPKVLILFCGSDGDIADLADAVAEGARSVRFCEADVRHVESHTSPQPSQLNSGVNQGRARQADPHGSFASIEALPEYDALVLGSPVHGGGMCGELRSLLDRASTVQPAGRLRDRVGAAFTSAGAAGESAEKDSSAGKWSMLEALAKLGMILVPGAGGIVANDQATALAAARELGRRVATVSEWVRHAKAHEHGHSHTHGNAHGHAH